VAAKFELPITPVFFANPSSFCTWLEEYHADAPALWVGFYKKGSGKASITWPEAVAEALCFGWIDGVRKSVDDDSYTIRFTPRRPRSIWSAVNVETALQLIRSGRMRPEGLKAFEERKKERSSVYSYEQKEDARLNDADEQQFRVNAIAWDFFQSQPAGYRKTALHWVMSAKKEETRRKRLTTLVEDSAHHRTLAQFTRQAKPK
jgi:uncharacterized protein YdeI (YjbR/CyaY-like superfamily)